MRTLFLAGVALFVFCGVASANFRDPSLEKSLRPQLVKAFKQRAPSLTITTLRCMAPTSGVTAHCTMHFTVGSTKGYYPIAATIHDSGKLTWVAKSPKCLNPTTKKYVSCS